MPSKATLIRNLRPTQLIDPRERKPIPRLRPPSIRFRAWYVCYRLFTTWFGNAALSLFRSRNAISKKQERTIGCLQSLGMLWIRVAQMLILRKPALAETFGRQLMDLDDCGGAYPHETISDIVTHNLKRPLEEVFEVFEPQPFAASTVYQLHRARLGREQKWVAVKVQQPHARPIFTKDLLLFRRLTRVAKWLGIASGMRWDDLVHELEEIQIRELNYYYESTALATLDRNLAGRPIHVPKVYRRYSGKEVLVMEFVSGGLLADCMALQEKDPERLTSWLKTNHIQLKQVAYRLFQTIYRQVFEDNFFHGAMNTHNIILLRNGHLAVIDCRSAGSLEEESLTKQKLLLRAFAEREYSNAAEIYFLLSSRLPRVNLSRVKEELIRIWRVWETRVHIKNLDYDQKSITFMNGAVNRVLTDSQFAALWSFSILTGTWVHLDRALSFLHPGFNYLSQLRRYFKASTRRGTVDNIGQLPQRFASSMVALHAIPKRVSDYNLFEEIMLRREAQMIQGSTSKLDSVVAALFALGSFVLLWVAVFLVLAGVSQLKLYDTMGVMGPQLGWLAQKLPGIRPLGWIAVWTLSGAGFWICRLQRKRFRRREYGAHTRQ